VDSKPGLHGAHVVTAGAYHASQEMLQVWELASNQYERTLQLTGHTDSVLAIKLLPDGRLVSGSSDKTLRIWTLKVPQAEVVLRGHEATVRCLEVLPDGRFISGSWDTKLLLWHGGKNVREYVGHAGRVLCCCLQQLAVRPCHKDLDPRRYKEQQSRVKKDRQESVLVSGSADGRLRSWDIERGVCIQVFAGHRGQVFCVAQLKPGRILSGGEDMTLRIWDATTASCLHELRGHKGWVRSVAALPDGRIISGGEDALMRIWNY